MTSLRDLPSVDLLLSEPGCSDLVLVYGRRLTVDAIREALAEIRASHRNGDAVPPPNAILISTRRRLENWTAPSLVPVINATGVILHTNLGRAPLSRTALAAMSTAGTGYSNLEFDLETGKRGSRYGHTAALIARLSGAEDALVVNNNAAAVLLVLSALAARRRVVISRSQLVEIGGGFRIPDILRQSGAKLVEIGATNRVHLEDYAQALDTEPVKLVLAAHQSNYKIVGFASEPERAEIADLAHRHGVPFVEDLGSGTFLDTAAFGLAHEPTVPESLAAGADLVTFSGDKLLGGPQAGIIAGRADLIARLKRHPLARAIRADKTTYAGLSATLLHYLKDEAVTEIPVWRMIAADLDGLGRRAAAWSDRLAASVGADRASVMDGESTVGGGSLPGEILATRLVALRPPSAGAFLKNLRRAGPPVIARAAGDAVLLDPRTVLPEQDEALLQTIERTFHEI
ncbi:MAG TPA: L-seryl-tRNA(Sec) selenium transferase [Anaerolineales bacterium]|nr:L-seryl-tRNA(Sec) selenium transferase [Anaerolineales bacterium]